MILLLLADIGMGKTHLWSEIRELDSYDPSARTAVEIRIRHNPVYGAGVLTIQLRILFSKHSFGLWQKKLFLHTWKYNVLIKYLKLW